MSEQDVPMDDVEVAEVMTILTALDRWLQVTEEQVKVWQQVLRASHPKLAFRPVRLEDARAAAVRLVTEREKADATPGLLIGEVVRLRTERQKAVSAASLVPPDSLAPGQYPQWLRAAQRHVGDGKPVRAALDAADSDMGVGRRALGPAQPRPLQAALRRIEGRSA